MKRRDFLRGSAAVVTAAILPTLPKKIIAESGYCEVVGPLAFSIESVPVRPVTRAMKTEINSLVLKKLVRLDPLCQIYINRISKEPVLTTDEKWQLANPEKARRHKRWAEHYHFKDKEAICAPHYSSQGVSEWKRNEDGTVYLARIAQPGRAASF